MTFLPEAVQEAGQAPARAEELGDVPARRPPHQPPAPRGHVRGLLRPAYPLPGDSHDQVPDGQALPCRRASESSPGSWGGLVHADETRGQPAERSKGYVWVLANLEDVVYMYRPNREAAFLQDLLKDFKGVLVSDFYSGYDSLPCEQQKCLIHLIRDINDDLKGNPYDEEFKALAAEFGKLLRSIVDTIDKYGLKKTPPAQAQGRGRPLLPRSGRPASTAPSWRRATRSGFPRTRASCSHSWTTTGSPGTTIPPSTRSRRSPTTARITDGMMSEGGALRLPRAAERLADLQVPGRQLPQVPALAGEGCRGLLPAEAEEVPQHSCPGDLPGRTSPERTPTMEGQGGRIRRDSGTAIMAQNPLPPRPRLGQTWWLFTCFDHETAPRRQSRRSSSATTVARRTWRLARAWAGGRHEPARRVNPAVRDCGGIPSSPHPPARACLG